MNDVERLESLRCRVQHLGTVSQEDTRWLWEMARECINKKYEHCFDWDYMRKKWVPTVQYVEPLAPRRKRCDECGGEGVFPSGIDGKLTVDCPDCGGSGYQPLENPE